MRSSSTFALVFAVCSTIVLSATAHGVTVALGTGLERNDYSSFWGTLRDAGYEPTVESYEAVGATLRQQGARVEHLIIFGSTTKNLPAELSPQRLSALLNSGTNVLLALPPNSTDVWRDFAREFEIDMAERGTQAVDHFEFDLDADDGSHTSLVLPISGDSTPFVSPSTQTGPPVLYRGALHATGRSPLLRSILSVPSTTYSAQIDSPLEDLRYYGSRSAAVSGFQARNNARLAVVGSLDVFSDRAANSPIRTQQSSYPKSGNAAFLADLARWTFGTTGQRRVVAVSHGVAGGELSNPKSYRVRDELHYVLDVDSSDRPTPEDLQLEVTMLDPHLRIPLKHRRLSDARERFEATFQLPDRHGVFTLRVDHRRSGWSNLETATVVSVTPPRHDEYERFIQGAAPYYGGALSVSLGLLVFVVMWIVQS